MRRKSIIDAVQGRRARIEPRAPSAEEAPRPKSKIASLLALRTKFGRAHKIHRVFATGLFDAVRSRASTICSPPSFDNLFAAKVRASRKRLSSAAGRRLNEPARRPLLGLALHECYGSIVAQVVEIATAGGKPAPIERVTCAIDCGVIVHPAAVVAQMEEGVVMGLSEALHDGIRVRFRPCELRRAVRPRSCQCRAAWRRAPTPSRVTSIS